MNHQDDEKTYSLETCMGSDVLYSEIEISELRTLCTKAKARGDESVCLEFAADEEIVRNVLGSTTAGFRIAYAVETIEEEDPDLSGDAFGNLRESAFDAYWEKLPDDEKREFAEDQIARLVMDYHSYIIDYLKDEFNELSEYDVSLFAEFVRDCGFGKLLKGE